MARYRGVLYILYITRILTGLQEIYNILQEQRKLSMWETEQGPRKVTYNL